MGMRSEFNHGEHGGTRSEEEGFRDVVFLFSISPCFSVFSVVKFPGSKEGSCEAGISVNKVELIAEGQKRKRVRRNAVFMSGIPLRMPCFEVRWLSETATPL